MHHGESRHPHPRPHRVRHAAAIAACALGALLAAGCSGGGTGSTPAASAASGATGGAKTSAGANGGTAPASPGPSSGATGAADGPGASGPVRIGNVQTVAQVAGASLAIYASQGSTTVWRTMKNPTASGAPLVLLVLERHPGWARVLLPVRPNGSQGWVRTTDVRLGQHPYRIVVSRGKHTLTLYRGTSVVFTEKVGVGTSGTPTPGGVYYTKELLQPPKPNGPYGPYAIGLSGFSPVLNEFLGGDGTIGIHGTNDPSSIGKDVSHGCIRMTNAAITKLAKLLPLGVPVQIVA